MHSVEFAPLYVGAALATAAWVGRKQNSRRDSGLLLIGAMAFIGVTIVLRVLQPAG